MDINQLKILMNGIPHVTAVFLDLDMFKRMIHTFSRNHVLALDAYYKFLINNNQLTIFDKERYEVVVDKLNEDKSFHIINTGIGFVKLSNN